MNSPESKLIKHTSVNCETAELCFDEQKIEISNERSYNHMTVKVNVSKKTSVTWTTFTVKSEFTPKLNPRYT